MSVPGIGPDQIYGDVVNQPPFTAEQQTHIDAFHKAKASWIKAKAEFDQANAERTKNAHQVTPGGPEIEEPNAAQAFIVARNRFQNAQGWLDQSILKLLQLKDKVTIFPCPDIKPKVPAPAQGYDLPDDRDDYNRWSAVKDTPRVPISLPRANGCDRDDYDWWNSR